jgi:lipopolysaccharide export system permease protein
VSVLVPKLYFRYLAKHYFLNLIAILLGLSLAFAIIDFFQHIQSLNTTISSKILYIFYIWQEALKLLYPLAIIFALIMSKINLIKHNNMSAFYALGYNNKQLIKPILAVAFGVYAIFVLLSTTEFVYAKEKAISILKKQSYDYNVDDIFFKYQDTFVYMKKLYPVEKTIEQITIFKVKNKKVLYTIHAPYATYDGLSWIAKNAILKTHNYTNNQLTSYKIEHKDSIKTLTGYKPKIIRSLYEGKSLSTLDAFNTYRLLKREHINTDKIKTSLYSALVVPLFAIAFVIILFFKMPYLGRMSSMGLVIASSLGATFVVWGLFFGLIRLASSGVVASEILLVIPVVLLWIYALYLYILGDKKLA